MIVRAALFKWLLIGLMVVSFAGRPWTESIAAGAMHGCGTFSAAGTETANSTMTYELGKIAAGDAATPKYDSGKTKSADCVKSCAAVQILGLAAVAWSLDVWPQIHSATIEIALNGHPPKPELSPPIALV